ncbi:SusC/RagA family TonB-linked outer membrane protein [Chondrinema litorale]|uniref:SusC/RagA family TonB-linked outer membrane protein n=1 Tax=Chondrinema litorale TaxID=2994555 RepID=UPI0025439C69|nr:TonB-dependent receptor [Chondrinema litorale]UZR96843.1 TonB-dependent receptor [Chondrinema litorale]
MKLKILHQILSMAKYMFYGLILQAFLSSFLIPGDSHGQKNSVFDIELSVKSEENSLEEVFNDIEGQTGFKFTYFQDDIINQINTKYTFNFPQKSLGYILREISLQSGLAFKRVNENISVVKKNKNRNTSEVLEVFDQQIKISGTVTSAEDGEPLPGVNVLIKGTQSGTTTNFDGKYSLEAPSGSVLLFSYIGFIPQEFTLGGESTINVALNVDTDQLEEVVVVGYGSQISKEVTGAVQQIKAEELQDLPVAQVTQKLQGRMAGVQINQTTGKPGQGMQVRIRGQASILAGSDPLYVVDGFPIVGDISTINPDEIESVSVLKDAASTAMYGSRAANGVVLITTKSGTSGKTTISLNAYAGVQQVPQKGRPDLMNGEEFARFQKESYEDRGQAVPAPFQNPSEYGDGYDWYGGMLRTAPIQNYSVSINTGKDNFSTSAVLGYFNQDGVMHNSDFTRYSLRINSNFNVSKKIKTGFNVAPTYSVNNIPSSDGAFYATNQDAAVPGGLLSNAMLTWPILPYENEDGSLPLTAYIPGISAFPTPNWYKALEEITNQSKTIRMLSNAFIEVTPIEGLSLKSTINIDLANTDFVNFKPSTVSTTFASLPPTVATSFRNSNFYTSWLNENLVTYSKSFSDHNFEVLGGFSTQKYKSDFQQIRGTDFPDDRIQAIQSAVNIDRTQTFDRIEEWGLISYLARLSYNYKGKYLFTASIRRDGSSRFGINNQWGNFPSVSAGWVISDEPFLYNSEKISFLKARASYGIIGNNNIGNYTQYAAVSTTTNAVFGSTVAPGASITSIGNNQLGWETTKQFDIGFDLGLFDDRITFTYDYYKKNTTNLLYNVTVPQESGFETINANVGEFEFWGHEVTINSNNLTGNFKWKTDFNISFNDNRVVALSDGVDRLYGGFGNYVTITMVGERIGQFWGLIHDGVYVDQADFDSSPKATASEVGTAKYQDVNGDGVITFGGDEDDRTFIGNPFPKFIYGFTNTFNYKNFDLSIVCAGSYGNDIMVMTDQGTTNLDGVFNVVKGIENRWRSPENPGDGLFGKSTSATWMERDWASTRFVDSGNYLTIKNITLGYNIPVGNSNVFKSIRLNASVQQVLVLTQYRGVNPEVSAAVNGTATGSALNLGMDWGTFPVPRTYTLGVNFGI